MLAPDAFIPLGEWLVPRGAIPTPSEVSAPMTPADMEPAIAEIASSVAMPLAELARELRVFRAALAEAAVVARTTLITDVAVAVLGRELQSAPVALDAIVARAVAERRADEPLRVRVAPADAGIACALSVVADPELLPGDAMLECTGGGIDLTLGIRLSDVIAAFR